MKKHLTEYMDWLYTSVPEIRRFTGSELSASIQRFSQLTVETLLRADKNTVVIPVGW